MILQTEGASIATRSMSTSVDANGAFCFKVAAGVHSIQVVKPSCHPIFLLTLHLKLYVIKLIKLDETIIKIYVQVSSDAK